MFLASQKLTFLIVYFTNNRCHISAPFLLYQSIEHAEQKVVSTLLLVTYSSTMNMNHHVPLHCSQLSIRLHGIRPHKTPVFSLLLCFVTTYSIFISSSTWFEVITKHKHHRRGYICPTGCYQTY